MYYLDEKVKNLNRIFDQNSRKKYLRLDLNENPGGLPETFIKKVLSDVSPRLVSEYPETLEFTEVLARYLHAKIENICLTNGSAEGIRYIIQAFTSPDGKIVGVTPSYAMFEVYSNLYGRNFTPVPYTEDMEMPVERILNEMTPDTQLLILVNPNNPVGNVYTDAEFSSLLDKAEENKITVLIDEAYHYFYPESFLPYALKRRHLFVTRTFSKIFSMAGLRLGYVAGWPDGIAMIQKMCTPHNVNAFAELFAQKILEEPELLQTLIHHYQEGRDYLERTLTAHGYFYLGQTGNFIFIQQKTEADTLVRRMKEEKEILIKSYNGIGKMGNCLRVTIGEKQYMERFIEALLELDR